MVRMVNRVTGSDMWVHNTRVDEYLAAGHRLATPPAPPAPSAPVKRPQKKTAKKAEA